MGKLLTLFVLLTLSACQTESHPGKSTRSITLITPSGKSIRTAMAITPQEQEQGLSGVRPQDFDDDQAMLFYYLSEDEKFFWMPDTYFDLDIFFLDRDLKIIDVIRKLPHYIGRANPELIPRARGVWSRHALEMKSTSAISQELKIGDQLTWKGGFTSADAENIAREN